MMLSLQPSLRDHGLERSLALSLSCHASTPSPAIINSRSPGFAGRREEFLLMPGDELRIDFAGGEFLVADEP